LALLLFFNYLHVVNRFSYALDYGMNKKINATIIFINVFNKLCIVIV